MPAWCEACDWGVRSTVEAPRGVVDRRVDATLRRSAQRLHARLAADPDVVGAAPSRTGALVLAVTVLLGSLLALVLALWWAFSLVGWWRVVALALLGLVVWELVPRPARLPRSVTAVTPDEAPGLHALVARLADDVGVRAPEVVGIDTDWNAGVGSLGWGRRRALVVGLPLWTSLDADERVFLLGHELGHLRSRDTTAGRTIGAAGDLLTRAAGVLWPGPVTDHGDLLLTASSAIGSVVQRAVAAPVIGVLVALVRLDATQSQHAEYVADRLAARAAGPSSGVTLLSSSLHPIRGLTAAQVAARTGADPWSAIEGADRPTARELRRRRRESELSRHRADATHPPTSLRLDLLERMPATAPTGLDAALLDRADEDMRRLRGPLTRRFAEELVHGRF